MAAFLVLLLIGFTVYTNKTSSQANQDLDKFLLYPNVKEVVKTKTVVSVTDVEDSTIKDSTDTLVNDDAITDPTQVLVSQDKQKPLEGNENPDDNIVYLASLAPVEIYKEGLSQDADSCEYMNHTVEEGETVQSIAEDYVVSPNTILFENDMKPDDIIKPGDNLAIPCLTNAAKHTVRKGETLLGIAEYHEIEPEKVIEFNNIEDPESLTEGETLIIPDSARVVELIEDQQAAEEAERARLAALEAQKKAAAAKKTTASSKSSSSSSSGGSTKIVNKGYYILPVGGSVNYKRGIHANNGIDISGNSGYSVLAAASGTVVKSACGWNGGYGCVVEIKHSNGTKTRYAHLRSGSISVKTGQKVGQGQSIGRVGSTGRSTGPHLHFEVHGARNPYLG